MGKLVLWFALSLGVAFPAAAQDERSAGGSLQAVSPEEARTLRRIAEEAVPAAAYADAAALRRHFNAKNDATRRLDDPGLRLRVLRDAMAALPQDAIWPNNLAWALRQQGDRAGSRQMIERAVEMAATPAARVFYQTARAQMLVLDMQPGAAAALDDAQASAKALLPQLAAASGDRVAVLRSLGSLAQGRTTLAAQADQLQASLAAAVEAEGWHREALAAVNALPGDHRNAAIDAAAGLAGSMRHRGSALARLGRLAEAEAAVAERLAFLPRYRLPASLSAEAHHDLGGLLALRGEHERAEAQLRLALDTLDKLNYPPQAPARLDKLRDIAISQWARERFAQARQTFDELDRAAGVRPGSRPQAYASWRALVYLSSDAAEAATPLFEQTARQLRERLGPAHFYTAQAEGLHGAALRRSADPARRDSGAELLRQAVVTMLSPRNTPYLEELGVRRQIRTVVFDAYLEASAERGAMQALAALGTADRLIAGGTGQAVADAALRSAAGNPALADLVRQEQDVRARLRALQQAQNTEPRAAGSDDAERTRLVELETQRQQLQDRIRLAFPGYDRLLQPPLPNASDVAQRLGRDEVLLLALPTRRWLYLWALNADELPQFVRVDIGADTIAALVRRLREGLDFGLRRDPQFDAAAAHELYRHLLAPVAARLAGRKHLIVATTGPLTTIPLPALLTAPMGGSGPVPYLARQLAVSSVPNLASWLALRQLPPAQRAPEPLLAWADPQFATTAGTAATTRDTASAVDYQRLPRLPETRGEALAIATALKARPEADILSGERATRSSVLELNRSGQLARKRVLLFATHGLIAGDLPGLEQPALALAAEAGKAGLSALLGLDDILGLKLNAEWVVLSACNTAAGDGKAEEALSGLARGFLYAGTRSLLVTHWAVETESAKLLTTATFEHQATEPAATKAESLRQAMLKVMAMPRYARPAYWAPFALVGDGGR